LFYLHVGVVLYLIAIFYTNIVKNLAKKLNTKALFSQNELFFTFFNKILANSVKKMYITYVFLCPQEIL